MMNETLPVLRFSKVSKAYQQDKTKALTIALDKLDFELYPGMVLGLLGKNGAGKSTLIRTALGIIAADSGTIETLGEAPTELSAQTKQKIGYVPQQPFGYEGFSVEQALDLHSSFYHDWNNELEQQWLARFELDKKQVVQKLSVGQRQSLALIMAMSYRPKLLVLDEPVASLDPIARRDFMSDLFELALESSSAVLFSSHITSDIERVASHVALLKDGKLMLCDEIDALREKIKIVSNPQNITLPASIKILSKGNGKLLIENGSTNDDVFPEGVSVQSLSLENLFVELHQ
ncbi:MAG: ABC transporter ATP-binding protein [Parashewanella sp.]